MARSEEEEFILSLPRFATEAHAQKRTFDFNIAEYYFSRADQLCSVIFIMYMTLQNGSDRLCELFQILLSHFLAIRQTFQDRMESLSRDAGMGSRDGVDGLPAAAQRDGSVGRPMLVVDPSRVQSLREFGFNWKSIAAMLGISERTLRNRRRDFNLNESFTPLSDEELDRELVQIRRVSERSGETFMIGALRARGTNC